MSLDDIRADPVASETPDVARIDVTTEDDIARFNAEDGFDPDDTLRGLRPVVSPSALRERAGLTQAEMALRLTVPLQTWRDWEQGRVTLEPAVRALLALVAADHERAFQTLDGGLHAPGPRPGEDRVGTAGGALGEAEERRRAG